jgi:hypothetical protein
MSTSYSMKYAEGSELLVGLFFVVLVSHVTLFASLSFSAVILVP